MEIIISMRCFTNFIERLKKTENRMEDRAAIHVSFSQSPYAS